MPRRLRYVDWGHVPARSDRVAALLDHLLHHSDVFVTSGESWRLKEAHARARSPMTSPPTMGAAIPSVKEDLRTLQTQPEWGLHLATSDDQLWPLLGNSRLIGKFGDDLPVKLHLE